MLNSTSLIESLRFAGLSHLPVVFRTNEGEILHPEMIDNTMDNLVEINITKNADPMKTANLISELSQDEIHRGKNLAATAWTDEGDRCDILKVISNETSIIVLIDNP